MNALKDTSNPDVLAVQAGLPGCVRLFFLAIGLTLVATAVGPGAFRNRPGNDVPWYVALPVGVGLIAGGLYRIVRTVDRAAGRVETRHCCVIPLFTKAQNIDRSGNVVLKRELRSTSESEWTVYPIHLVGTGMELEISADVSEIDARDDAERLARFLNLPLHDSSTGTLQVRDPDKLDESVGQRAQRLGARTELAAPPQLQTQVDLSADALRLVVPPQGWRFKVWAGYTPLALFGLWCLWILWKPPSFLEKPEVGQWVVGIAGSILFGILPVALGVIAPFADATRQVTLDVSPTAIRIVTRWLGWQHERTISGDAIEDVSVSGPTAKDDKFDAYRERAAHERQIVIRTDKQTFRFGRHLPAAEQEYLCRLISATLESGAA